MIKSAAFIYKTMSRNIRSVFASTFIFSSRFNLCIRPLRFDPDDLITSERQSVFTHLYDGIRHRRRLFLRYGHEAEASEELMGVGAGRDARRVWRDEPLPWEPQRRGEGERERERTSGRFRRELGIKVESVVRSAGGRFERRRNFCAEKFLQEGERQKLQQKNKNKNKIFCFCRNWRSSRSGWRTNVSWFPPRRPGRRLKANKPQFP